MCFVFCGNTLFWKADIVMCILGHLNAFTIKIRIWVHWSDHADVSDGILMQSFPWGSFSEIKLITSPVFESFCSFSASKKLEIIERLSESTRCSCPMTRSNATSPHSSSRRYRCSRDLMTPFQWRRSSRTCWGPKNRNRSKSGSSDRWAEFQLCLFLTHHPHEVEAEGEINTRLQS